MRIIILDKETSHTVPLVRSASYSKCKNEIHYKNERILHAVDEVATMSYLPFFFYDLYIS